MYLFTIVLFPQHAEIWFHQLCLSSIQWSTRQITIVKWYENKPYILSRRLLILNLLIQLNNNTKTKKLAFSNQI